MTVTGEAKGAFNAIKSHWIAFAVIGVAVVALALSYDHKNSGSLTARLAKLPLIGKLFTPTA